ncbi:MAG: LPS export ABC transporter ATP-binding protein [candidate division Zixibacteria bacterium]|nr:LPS export ABC transporter ATP-binding protein [candidate division Zixibacteria bacterium]
MTDLKPSEPGRSTTVLESHNLVKYFRRRAVVNGVSIQVNPGEVVGLLGPNGAGKTTTFYMIIGFIRPDEGQVFLGKSNIGRWPMYRRAGLGIGYLAQEASVFRKLSVEDNIMAILQFRNLGRKARKQRLEELLNELDIAHLRKSKAYTLSGGERRRVEITRALVMEPKFILLDEPFAGIDPIAVEDIQKIIQRLVSNGLGVLITDHNVRETLSICNRAYIMFDGKILKAGTSEYLAQDPEARKIYLGEKFRLH